MNREFSVCICGFACEHFILLFLCFFSLLLLKIQILLCMLMIDLGYCFFGGRFTPDRDQSSRKGGLPC